MAQATSGPGGADGTGSSDEGHPRLPLVDGGTDRPRLHPNFTGRDNELAALRGELGPGTFPAFKPAISVLHGTGGMGKTQIALEYKLRHAPEYELVWWVNAHEDRYSQGEQIMGSIQALGRRLGIPLVSPENQNQYRGDVIGALQSGTPYRRWLLIFDDVTNPEILGRFIPDGAGHVIVTSQHREWQSHLGSPGIEVKAFLRDDTIAFLRSGRIEELAPDSNEERDAARQATAGRLADTFGDMPLAAEIAASYLQQKPPPTVDQYIEKFENDPQDAMGQPADTFTDKRVATTWKLSLERLSAEARSLFDLLTFFGPAPIAEEILRMPPGWAPTSELLEPLRPVLTSPEALNAAERELYRFSLIDWTEQNRVQLARVLRGWMKAHTESDRKEYAEALRDTVLTLLAATDPQKPEEEQNDSAYAWSLDHLRPAGALESADKQLRTLVINQVRRLRMRDHREQALSLGEDALKIWRAAPDDFQTLAMSVEVAIALRMLGRVKEAFQLSGDTVRRLEAKRGTADPTYLICANSYGEDLRQQGRYEDALANDLGLQEAFGGAFPSDEYRVFSLQNNIALDMRCVGQYGEALNKDQGTAEQREKRYGRDDWQTLSSLYGMSSSLRQLGRYRESLGIDDEAAALAEAHGRERESLLRFSVLSGKSVSLRRAGRYREARDLAEEVYVRCKTYAGPEHRATLVAATNLICDFLFDEKPAEAEELGEATVAAWDRVVAAARLADDHAPHPNALIARANLALVYRARGNLVEARAMDEAALDGFEKVFSDVHPYHLIAMTNLASDLAAVGEVAEARRLGEDVRNLRLRAERHPVDPGEGVAAGEAAPLSEEVRTQMRLEQRGKDTYPIRLAGAANLALDLMVTNEDEARALAAETLPKLDELLSPDHPQAIRARRCGRLNLDLEPMTY
jgi:tetratricopeptide (TPR) repeat protein